MVEQNTMEPLREWTNEEHLRTVCDMMDLFRRHPDPKPQPQPTSTVVAVVVAAVGVVSFVAL